MRIVWNPDGFFEAQFQDFQGDLESVKAAGFRTTGAPDWKWYTPKIGPLDKLRKNRPASGLTIMEDALAEYNRQKEREEKKAAILAELKAAKKKFRQDCAPEGAAPVPAGQEFGYNKVEDCEPKIHIGYVPPIWNGPVCRVCKDHLYFYESQNPPLCLWCEVSLDNAPEIF